MNNLIKQTTFLSLVNDYQTSPFLARILSLRESPVEVSSCRSKQEISKIIKVKSTFFLKLCILILKIIVLSSCITSVDALNYTQDTFISPSVSEPLPKDIQIKLWIFSSFFLFLSVLGPLFLFKRIYDFFLQRPMAQRVSLLGAFLHIVFKGICAAVSTSAFSFSIRFLFVAITLYLSSIVFRNQCRNFINRFSLSVFLNLACVSVTLLVFFLEGVEALAIQPIEPYTPYEDYSLVAQGLIVLISGLVGVALMIVRYIQTVPAPRLVGVEPNPGPSPRQQEALASLRNIASKSTNVESRECSMCPKGLFKSSTPESIIEDHLLEGTHIMSCTISYRERVYVILKDNLNFTDTLCLECYLDFWLRHGTCKCQKCQLISPSVIYANLKENSHMHSMMLDERYLQLVASCTKRSKKKKLATLTPQMGLLDAFPGVGSITRVTAILTKVASLCTTDQDEQGTLISEFLSSVIFTFGEVQLRTLLLLVCCVIYSYHGPSPITAVIIGIAISAHKRGAEQLKKDFSNFSELCRNYMPQSGFDTMVELVLLYFSVTKSTGVLKIVSELLKNLAHFSQRKRDITDVLETIGKFLQEIYNQVVSKQFGFPDVSFFEDLFPQCTLWCNQVDSMKKLLLKDEVPTAQRFSELDELYKEGVKIRAKSMQFVKLKHLTTQIHEALRFLDTVLNDYATKGIFRSGVRFEPLAICIRGGTSLGKSFMTGPLLTKLMACVVPDHLLEIFKENPGAFIYSAAPENQYWDGYTGQFATTFDDFGQARDVAGSPDNEYFKLIRCVNTSEYMLHMADVQSKGSVFFDSKIVLASTNLGEFRPQSIISSAAVTRRFDIDVTIEVVSEFSKLVDGQVRIDASKLDGSYNRTVHIFKDNLTNMKYTFDELIERAVNIYRTKEGVFHKKITDLSGFVSEGLKMRPQMGEESFGSKILSAIKEVKDSITTYLSVDIFFALSLVTGFSTLLYGMRAMGALPKEPEYVAQDDLTSHLMIKSMMKKNVLSFSIEGNHLGYLTFLANTDAIYPCHYYHRLKNVEQDRVLEFFQFGSLVGVLTVADFVKLSTPYSENEAAIVTFPLNFKNHKNILNCFVSEEAFGNRGKGKMLFSKPDKDGSYCVKEMNFRVLSKYKTGIFHEETTFERMISYPGNTVAGDCGLPIFIDDRTTRGEKIIGFHVAGSACGQSLGVSFDVKRLYDEHLKMRAQLNIENLETMRKIGEIPNPVGFQSFTSFRRSPLHNKVWESKKSPAALMKSQTKTGVNPFDKAVLGYDVPEAEFDEKLIGPCLETVFSLIVNGSNYRELKVLPYDTAVLGDLNNPYINSIPRSTSAGYPYNVQRVPGMSGKTRFFGKDQEFDLTRPEALALKESVFSQLDKVKESRGEFLYTDNLKDELRTFEKVACGNTRLFSASPIEFSILVAMYFKDISAWMMENRMGTGVWPGVNPYSEWGVLAKRLLTVSNNLMSGDFTAFDKKQSSKVVRRMVQYINRLYADGEENALIRENLWKDIYSSKHIVGRDVLQWSHSNPSGQPLTTVVNCLYNMFLHVYAWVKVHDDDLDCLKYFSKNVSLNVFGDDSILAVSDDKKDLYNQQTLKDVFAKCGIIYTDESKSENIVPYRTLDEVTFLKRSFSFSPEIGRYVAPLALSSIQEMVNWSKKGADYHEICNTNVDTALHELSLHGESVYNELAPKLIEQSRIYLGFQPNFIEWKSLFFETCGYSNKW